MGPEPLASMQSAIHEHHSAVMTPCGNDVNPRRPSGRIQTLRVVFYTCDECVGIMWKRL